MYFHRIRRALYIVCLSCGTSAGVMVILLLELRVWHWTVALILRPCRVVMAICMLRLGLRMCRMSMVVLSMLLG